MMPSEVTYSNFLLACVPPSELTRLVEIMSPAPLIPGNVIYNVGDPMDVIYFPCGGLVSDMLFLGDGGCLEVLSVGREGALGIGALYGAPNSFHKITVQMGGGAWKIHSTALVRALESCPALNDRLGRYFNSLFLQASQTAICAGRHTIAQRCAGKLVDASEKSGSIRLPFTHQCLASALGVRRAGITVALAAFEHAGLIRCQHASIEILDADLLREAACECCASQRNVRPLAPDARAVRLSQAHESVREPTRAAPANLCVAR